MTSPPNWTPLTSGHSPPSLLPPHTIPQFSTHEDFAKRLSMIKQARAEPSASSSTTYPTHWGTPCADVFIHNEFLQTLAADVSYTLFWALESTAILTPKHHSFFLHFPSLHLAAQAIPRLSKLSFGNTHFSSPSTVRFAHHQIALSPPPTHIHNPHITFDVPHNYFDQTFPDSSFLLNPEHFNPQLQLTIPSSPSLPSSPPSHLPPDFTLQQHLTTSQAALSHITHTIESLFTTKLYPHLTTIHQSIQELNHKLDFQTTQLLQFKTELRNLATPFHLSIPDLAHSAGSTSIGYSYGHFHSQSPERQSPARSSPLSKFTAATVGTCYCYSDSDSTDVDFDNPYLSND